ncbi:hypothetical protein AMJ80_10415 [bacterium SM23_31]|nr:MAG: hypothetical protein AMJ80_10415 [bacterium SM23_31]
MKSTIIQTKKKAAFTIVELLTVMSIIVILIGLLVPAINMAKRYAQLVKQKAQFHSMDGAIELYNTEFEGYPPSNALDSAGESYCGAMKLCEAMMGQDLMGFHPNSLFRADGTDGVSFDFYNSNTESARIGTYLPLESADAYRISQIYGTQGNFVNDNFVLCDVYSQQTKTGIKTGMPILYFKANVSKTSHDASTPANDIFNYLDNDELVNFGMPWEAAPPAGPAHPISSTGFDTRYKINGNPVPSDPRIFYEHTRSEKITTISRPYKSDSYILLSAGFDGEYGTRDDVYNFDKSLIDFVDFIQQNP